MSYLVLARKWRPRRFADVVGQSHVLKALIHGLNNNRLHHAFLFSGTRGVGKTTLARILAKSINCQQGVSATPCEECQHCHDIDKGQFPDLIEVDAASRTKVDDTRELLEGSRYAPNRGRYKVYLIDEVHMLSTSSFNALLKTLEEPPEHVKFVFATTEPQKIPVTVLSRCIQFNLKRVTQTDIGQHLSHILSHEAINYESAAIELIARAADGSLRDALSILDQAIAYSDGNISELSVQSMLGVLSTPQRDTMLMQLINGDVKGLMALTAEMAQEGGQFIILLDDLLRLLQRIATQQAIPDLAHTETDSPQLKTFAQLLTTEQSQLLYQIALHGKRDLSYAADPQSGFEMTLLRMLYFKPMEHSEAVSDKPQSAPTLHQDTPAVPATSNDLISTAADTATTSTDRNNLHSTRQPIPPPTTEHRLTKKTPLPAETVINTKPSSDSDNATAPISLDKAAWLSLMRQLSLTGMARQLADNSAFIQQNNHKITIAIADELAHLASTKLKNKLTHAINDHLDLLEPLTLNIEHQQQDNDTVAAIQTKNEALQHANAQQAIENDPAITALADTFHATVLSNTITPVQQEDKQ